MHTRTSALPKLPNRVASAILKGEPPLSALRQWRQLSIDDLSAASGVSPVVIRLVEAGSPLSAQARANLARALRVQESALVDWDGSQKRDEPWKGSPSI